MTKQPDHLPEIAEAGAPAGIAPIYARIRHLTGAPMTALIWRHLATFPGALPEVWRAIGPFYEAGILQETAWSVARRTVTAPSADVTRPALAAAGVSSENCQAYGRILAAYNRANPVNFIAVRTLLHRMALPGDAIVAPPMRAWSPPSPVGDLPPMIPVADLSASDRTCIDALCTDPRLDRSTLVPSLYRHLPTLGPLIAMIHAAVLPRIESGEIPSAVRTVAASLDAEAQSLAHKLPPIEGLARIDGVTATFTRFSLVIPEMVVIGLLLERALGEPD